MIEFDVLCSDPHNDDNSPMKACRQAFNHSERARLHYESYMNERKNNPNLASQCNVLDIQLLRDAAVHYTSKKDYDFALECLERVIALKSKDDDELRLDIMPSYIALYYLKDKQQLDSKSALSYKLTGGFFREKGNSCLSSLMRQPPEFIRSGQLTQKKLLGKGRYGEVYYGTWLRGLAFKAIAIKNHKNWKIFLQEIMMHADLKHPNIVSLLAVCTSPYHPCMILEWMNKGSLHDLLDRYKWLTEADRQQIGKQVVSALNYLHQKNIVHQDVKSHNVLVHQLDGEYNAKLSDFGGARPVSQTTNFGTPRYQAPEVLAKNGRNAKASDIYSFGFLLWELEAGDDVPPIEERQEITIPTDTPARIKQLITSCWEVCVDNRPTAQTLEDSLTAMVNSF